MVRSKTGSLFYQYCNELHNRPGPEWSISLSQIIVINGINKIVCFLYCMFQKLGSRSQINLILCCMYTQLSLTGRTSAIISLERSSYTVSEASGFVEVCADLEGLGVEEGDITVDIFTESLSATGKPTISKIVINVIGDYI